MTSNWEIKTLGEISQIVNGGTPDTTVQKFWDGEHLWITPKDMGKLDNIYVYDTSRKITDEGIKNSSAKILPANSIILSSRAPIGHLAINKKPISTNQGCKGLIPKNGVDTLYLYYFLSKSVELLNSLGTGATFKELSGAKLGTIEIPIPSLPQQKRIVSILDEAFATIAKLKANAEQNIKNVRELFSSYLQALLSNNIGDWEVENLGMVCAFENGDRGINYPSKAHRVEIGIPFVNAGHLTSEGLDVDNMDYISIERFNLLGSGKFQKGDILFCLRGSLGKFARVLEFSEGAIASSLVIVRPKSKLVPEFLMLYFQSKICADWIAHFRNGAAQPNLSAGNLKMFEILLPPISEQKVIVEKMNALAAETRKLETLYRTTIDNLDELKKSILQKAFSGELTKVEVVA